MPERSLTESIATIVRSAGVGVVASVVDLTALALMVHALHLAPRVASAPALLLGVLVQFVGNKTLAFRDRDPRWAPQAARFFAVEAVAFVANLALFDLATRALPLPAVLLRLATTSAVYFGLCLPLWSRIFSATPNAATDGGSR
ncbi:MAG: GtrA family protein [Polyangiales bacterium]